MSDFGQFKYFESTLKTIWTEKPNGAVSLFNIYIDYAYRELIQGVTSSALDWFGDSFVTPPTFFGNHKHKQKQHNKSILNASKFIPKENEEKYRLLSRFI